MLNITAGMALLGLVAVAAVSRVGSEMAQYETAAEGTSYLLGVFMRVLVAGVLVSVLVAALLKRVGARPFGRRHEADTVRHGDADAPVREAGLSAHMSEHEPDPFR